MKIRRLPETDLALIATLPIEQQRQRLERMNVGYAPFSYGPVRGRSHDVFNVQPGMFTSEAPTRWEVIEAQLGKACKSDDERKANLAVAKALHDYAVGHCVVGRAGDFMPLSMGSGYKVSYWAPLLLVIDGQALVPFIDPRKTHKLNGSAMRFVFSMMHERIRVADPDYADVEFGIFQFTTDDKGCRTPILHRDAGVDLYSLEQLEQMAAATYSIWEDVCRKRDDDAPRRATGTGGFDF